MKNRRLIGYAVFAVLLLLPSPVRPFDGPLPVRNQFPLFLGLDQPYLESAGARDFFSVDLSYSSVYLVENSRRWSVGLDLEAFEANIRYRKTIGSSFEIGIDVPVQGFNSGFLDGFLEDYHRIFGFPDYGRSERPHNAFLYEVKKDGKLIVGGDNGSIGLGDIRVSAKKVIRQDDPVVSLRADIELPTGDASRGFGNGSVDGGAGILIDKRLGEWIVAYGNLFAVFPGDLRGHDTARTKAYLFGGLSVEAALVKNVSVLGQISGQSSPFGETGISALDRPAVLFSIGGRYSTGKGSFEVSFTEDPNTAGAPDFILSFSYRRTL